MNILYIFSTAILFIITTELFAQQNPQKANYSFDSLAAVLDSIYQNDQVYRRKIRSTEENFGSNSEEMKQLWKTIVEKDSLNLILVENILDRFGWLGPDEVSRKGNQALFLVIQHADLETQMKYLPMMRKAVKNNKANPDELALLEDRVALRQGKRQIYGSQIGRNNDTGEYYVLPLEDPDNVDKRRATMGMSPLSEYVKTWEIDWNVEEYKKLLPKFEAK